MAQSRTYYERPRHGVDDTAVRYAEPMDIDHALAKARGPRVYHELGLYSPVQAILSGPTGCGKTTDLVKHIVPKMNWDRMVMVSPTLKQPAIDVLRDFCDHDPRCDGREAHFVGSINNEFVRDLVERMENGGRPLKPPDETACRAEQEGRLAHNLLVLDDLKKPLSTRDATFIDNLSTIARHGHCDIVYLTQKWNQLDHTPMQLRHNCNLAVIYRPHSDADASVLAREFATSPGMPIEKLRPLLLKLPDHTGLWIRREAYVPPHAAFTLGIDGLVRNYAELFGDEPKQEVVEDTSGNGVCAGEAGSDGAGEGDPAE